MKEYYGVLPTAEAKEKLKLRNIEEGYVQELQTINNIIDRGYSSNDLLFLGEAIVSFESQQSKQYLLAGQDNIQCYLYGHRLKFRQASHPKGIFWGNLHLNK